MGPTKPVRRLDVLLTVILALTVLNTAYLSWRFIALHAGWVTPGVGLCSWTETIDCDKVLMTFEARALYVPNAVLAFGFFFGCLIWWLVGLQLGERYRHHIIRTLAVWLGVATIFTFGFFWLLVQLEALCPLCPWNHVLTYFALGTAGTIWRSTPRPPEPAPRAPLVVLVCVCVGQFFLWQLLWLIAHSKGLL